MEHEDQAQIKTKKGTEGSKKETWRTSLVNIGGASSKFLLGLGAFTALVTYVLGFSSDIRKNELDFVNKQIQVLYGPLYGLAIMNDESWDALFENKTLWRKDGHIVFFDDGNPPTVEDVKRWRMAVKEILQRQNEQMESIIVNNSQLIIGNIMPKRFIDILKHAEGYKLLIAGWTNDDLDKCGGSVPLTVQSCAALSQTRNTPGNYPSGLSKCVNDDFNELMRRQKELEATWFAFSVARVTESNCN